MKKLLSILICALMVAGSVPLSISASAATSKAVVADSEPAEQQTTDPATEPETTEPVETTEPTQAPTEAPTTEPVTEAPTTEPVTEAPTEKPTKPVITPKKVSKFKTGKVKTTKVTLKWTLSKNATKYVVQRSAEKKNGKFTNYTTIKNAGKNTKTYTDKKLKQATVYKYRIYAFRVSDGVTTHSPANSLKVMTKPEAVKNSKGSEKQTTSALVSWSKNSKATSYVVYRSVENKNGKLSKFKKYKTIKTTKIHDTNLSSGTVYQYKIQAIRKKGSVSATSAAKTVKLMTKLESPQKFITKGITESSIKLAWSKVSRAKQYELYRNNYKIASTASTTYSDSVASRGSYTYKVRAVRFYNNKTYYGDFVSLSTSTAIDGVGSIKVKTYLKHGLFTWDAVSGASGYDVYVQRSNGKWLHKGDVTTNAYLTGKLKLDKTYKYAIKSYKLIGSTKVYGSTRKTKVRVTDNQAYGNTPSGTWVEVCTETQTMTMYVNNKPYITTPVVTGNYNNQDTTPGWHHVISRKSPARLRGSANGHSWDVMVSYWLGFTSDGQGIHDANWRSAFGGNIYKGNGSNGCVNTPTSAVSKIFAKAYAGMVVVVY